MDVNPAERNTSPFDLPAKTFVPAWLIFSGITCLVFYIGFVFNKPITDVGQVVWDFLRYLASPFI